MIYECLLFYTIGHDSSTATGWRTTLAEPFERLLREVGIEIESLDLSIACLMVPWWPHINMHTHNETDLRGLIFYRLPHPLALDGRRCRSGLLLLLFTPGGGDKQKSC
jgi:hypothetical protein